MTDIVILVVVKLIYIAGFFFGLKLWYDKVRLWIFPSLIYWFLGWYIIGVLSFNIFELFIAGELAALIGLVLYFVLGIMYFRPKKKPKP